MAEKPLVLVVDQPSEATRALLAFLDQNELRVIWSRDGESAFHALDEERVDCLVTELRVHRIDGMGILRRAIERNAEVCAVVMAESGDVSIAVEAMRQGAYDFQVKPLNPDKLLEVLRRGLSHQRLVARVEEMKESLDERFGLGSLDGNSRAAARISEQIRHVASTRASVLIEGEAGTGKSRVARAIHFNSARKDERFVWVNLGALGADAAEAELFGHEREEHEAIEPRTGRVELADHGTLFLDDVGAAPASVQVKLLRLLQDRDSSAWAARRRCGSTCGSSPPPSAISRSMSRPVAREDLYYRLRVILLEVPPLRERREDIPILVETFIREFNREHGRKVTGVTRGVLERLTRHAWPGNVRELRSVLEGMVVFANGKRPLDLSDLPASIRDSEHETERLSLVVGMTIEEAERQLIRATLRQTGFDKPRAASILGIGLRTLYRKIQEYGLR
jgi:DNA-binding NtrC family response regulator